MVELSFKLILVVWVTLDLMCISAFSVSERQRDVARKAQTSGPVDQQPKKQGLLNRSR